MASEKLFYVGVKGLIKNAHGEVLLLLADVSKHRKNVEPYWDIPGGRIQEGNDAPMTLKREIEEEIGITRLTDTEFLTAVISKHEIPLDNMDGNKSVGLILMIYAVSIPEDTKIIISEEHTAYEWVSRTEAKERLQHKYPKEFTDQL